LNETYRQYLPRKGGPEPLEKEINEILGSKREDDFRPLFLKWSKRILEGTEKCSEQIGLRTVQNVHNLSLTGYCEQNRLSLYMDGGSGGGVLSVTIESEVRLKFFLDTSLKMPPRTPAGQG